MATGSSLDVLVARYVALSPLLVEAWADRRNGPDDNAHTFFSALTRHVEYLLDAGRLRVLETIFDEVERSMEAADPDESNAAAVCFLENISNAFPEAYAWILPMLGTRSLRFLHGWEELSGEGDAFLSLTEARQLEARTP
jgi:hypothetical protein